MATATQQRTIHTSTVQIRNNIPFILLLLFLSVHSTSNYHPPLPVTSQVNTKLKRCNAKKTRRYIPDNLDVIEAEDYTNQMLFLVLLLLTIFQIVVFFVLEYKLLYGPY